MNRTELHIMIDRYFDGDLSIEEENLLVNTLLSMTERDEKAEEALAVMSWTHMPAEVMADSKTEPSSRRQRKQLGLFYRISAAASIAAVVITTAILLFANEREPECYAYIDGELIENRQEVESLISSQLSDMRIASDETSRQVISELDDIREAISMENMTISL